nr:MAG TPA: hypothetical protein [Bacteriophage sp.]
MVVHQDVRIDRYLMHTHQGWLQTVLNTVYRR